MDHLFAKAERSYGAEPPHDSAATRHLLLQIRFGLLPMAFFFAFAPMARAASGSATFQVTAAVVKACTFSTPSTLGFASYDPGASTPLDGTTNFSVTCTSGTPYSIGLNSGIGNGATLTNRVLTSSSAAAGSNTLSYGLYKDAAHTVSWDNSSSATGYSGTGAAQPITIYGRVPTNQYSAAPATDYADTVTMTLTY